MPEDLAQREPLRDQQPLALRRGDGDRRRRDAKDTRAALQVHLALLVNWMCERGSRTARGGFGVLAFYGNRAHQEGAVVEACQERSLRATIPAQRTLGVVVGLLVRRP